MRQHLPDDGDPILDSADREVERMLGRMSLKRPSARLDERVRHALTPHGPGGWFTAGALSAAAAAAVVLFALPILHRRPAATTPSVQIDGPGVSPVALTDAPRRLRVEQDAAGVEDDGIVARVNGVPLREYRCRALRQVWYFDAKRQTRLAVTVPVEQVVIVPIRTF